MWVEMTQEIRHWHALFSFFYTKAKVGWWKNDKRITSKNPQRSIFQINSKWLTTAPSRFSVHGHTCPCYDRAHGTVQHTLRREGGPEGRQLHFRQGHVSYRWSSGSKLARDGSRREMYVHPERPRNKQEKHDWHNQQTYVAMQNILDGFKLPLICDRHGD